MKIYDKPIGKIKIKFKENLDYCYIIDSNYMVYHIFDDKWRPKSLKELSKSVFYSFEKAEKILNLLKEKYYNNPIKE